MKLIEWNPGEEMLKVENTMAKHYDFEYDFGNRKLLPGHKEDRTRKINSYLISKPLADAVNAAIITGRPLLIKGDPGSGKTMLAQAVAAYFFGDEAMQYYFEWHVKSRSKAADGGYEFNHVQRLRDATIAAKDVSDKPTADDPHQYITLGPMGKAFASRPDEGKRAILLIDEIDKGDIDFPNDLLLELDEMRFKIHELKDYYIEANKAARPLVFITSNSERELPPAFLRRCLYYTIPSFGQSMLVSILKTKLKDFYTDLQIAEPMPLADDEISSVAKQFLEAKNRSSTKVPSTSEMLDWLKLMTYRYHRDGIRFEDLIAQKELQDLALKLNA